jgi:anti-anti-sigma factor
MVKLSGRRGDHRTIGRQAIGEALDEVQLNIDRNEHTATVRISGEIDLTSAPRLEDEVTGLIGDSVSNLTIELGGVSFMDSTGLRVLLKASKLLEGAGGNLVLRHPSDPVRRLLEISGLDTHFEIA